MHVSTRTRLNGWAENWKIYKMCVSIGLRKAFECLIIIEIMWSYLIGRLRLALNLAISCGRDFQGLTSTTGKKERERSWEIDFSRFIIRACLAVLLQFYHLNRSLVWSIHNGKMHAEKSTHAELHEDCAKGEENSEIFLIKEQWSLFSLFCFSRLGKIASPRCPAILLLSKPLDNIFFYLMFSQWQLLGSFSCFFFLSIDTVYISRFIGKNQLREVERASARARPCEFHWGISISNFQLILAVCLTKNFKFITSNNSFFHSLGFGFCARAYRCCPIPYPFIHQSQLEFKFNFFPLHIDSPVLSCAVGNWALRAQYHCDSLGDRVKSIYFFFQ